MLVVALVSPCGSDAFDPAVFFLLQYLVADDGGRVGADVLVDVAAECAHVVAVEEFGVGVAFHHDVHAVEGELDLHLSRGREHDGFLDCSEEGGGRQ